MACLRARARHLSRFALLAVPWLSGCHAEETTPVSVEPWARAFGDGAAQTQVHVAADAFGALALGGTFSGTIDFGGGPLADIFDLDSNVFLASLDPDGGHRWSHAAGSLGAQIVTGAAFDGRGNAVFTGMFEDQIDLGTGPMIALSRDTFVASVRPDGTAAWVQHFSADYGGPAGGGSSNPNGGVAVGGDGNIVLGGVFDGTFGFGGPVLDAPEGEQGAFVAKLDASGEHVFTVGIGGGDAVVNAVAADAKGSVAVTGNHAASIRLGDTTLFETEQGSFVARLDPDGTPRWLIPITGPGTSDARAVAFGEGGDIFVGGCFSTSVQIGDRTVTGTSERDGYVARLSAAGVPAWAALVPSTCVNALAVAKSGHAIVGGQYTGAPQLGGGALPFTSLSGAFVAEMSGDGKLVEATSFAHDGDVSAVHGIALADGALFAAGVFAGTLATSPQPLTSAGSSDVFVVRLRE
ncbi:MAG: hypothetical protein QM820_33840 [Minicystis sp.]